MKFIFTFLMLISSSVYGEIGDAVTKNIEWRLLNVNYMGVDYRKTYNMRDPYFPEYDTFHGACNGTTLNGEKSGECWKYGADAMFDLSFFHIPKVFDIFWRNTARMDATNRQVRHVGWKWEFGVDLGKCELKHSHLSRHFLDGKNESQKYPLEDFFIAECAFYGKKGLE